MRIEPMEKLVQITSESEAFTATEKKAMDALLQKKQSEAARVQEAQEYKRTVVNPDLQRIESLLMERERILNESGISDKEVLSIFAEQQSKLTRERRMLMMALSRQ